MSETHYCRRRGDLTAALTGQWPTEEEIASQPARVAPMPDTWKTDRWQRSGAEWPASWFPRTCSYCGGLHPEDAIRLVQEDWEVIGTDKGYKRYLEPPGYTAWCNAAQRSPGSPIDRTIAPPAVTPPAKLYTPHFTAEQIERFNAAIRRERTEGESWDTPGKEAP